MSYVEYDCKSTEKQNLVVQTVSEIGRRKLAASLPAFTVQRRKLVVSSLKGSPDFYENLWVVTSEREPVLRIFEPSKIIRTGSIPIDSHFCCAFKMFVKCN